MKSIRRLTIAAVVLLAIGEVAGIASNLAGGPWNDNAYRAYHLVQMVLAIAISFIIRKEVISQKTREGSQIGRWGKVLILIPIGLILSIIGDIINSQLIDLTFILKPQTLLSIPFFTIAHVFYIVAFYFVSNDTDLGVSVGFKKMSFGLTIWPIIAIGLWFLVIPSEADSFLKFASLFYAFVVTLMAVASFWVLQAWGRAGLFVPIGGVLFAVSDGIIGYSLLRPAGFYIQMVTWSAYFIAQLLIMWTPMVVLKAGGAPEQR